MKIVIYTIDDKDSPYCKDLKVYLQSRNLQFEEKRVDTNRDFLAAMQQVSDNFAGVPFTVVTKDNGEEVKMKGFTQSEFDAVFNPSAAPALSLNTNNSQPPVQSNQINTSVDPLEAPANVSEPQVSVPAPQTSQPLSVQQAPVLAQAPTPSSVPSAAAPSQNELDQILNNLNANASVAPVAAAPAAIPVSPTVVSQPVQQPPQPTVSQPQVPQGTNTASQMPQMPDFPQKQVN